MIVMFDIPKQIGDKGNMMEGLDGVLREQPWIIVAESTEEAFLKQHLEMTGNPHGPFLLSPRYFYVVQTD